MIKKLFLIALFTMMFWHTSFADELVADFKQESVPVLNEELRQLREEIRLLKDRVTALEP